MIASDTPSEKDGLYNVSASKDGGTVFDRQDVTPQQLEDIIGKDLAYKIVNETPNVYDRYEGNLTGELTGLELKVGGSGMKGFYDKIIPDYLNRYGKKFGARVGETRIGKAPEIQDHQGG